MQLPPSDGDLPCFPSGPAFAWVLLLSGLSFCDLYSPFALLFPFSFFLFSRYSESSASRFASFSLFSMRSHHVTMGLEKGIHVLVEMIHATAA